MTSDYRLLESLPYGRVTWSYEDGSWRELSRAEWRLLSVRARSWEERRLGGRQVTLREEERKKIREEGAPHPKLKPEERSFREREYTLEEVFLS